MKHFDISPMIQHKIAVFPGDKSFERVSSLNFEKGDHLRLSAIHTTLHVGAHVDAPNHYHKDGIAISECDLFAYLGPAQVIEIRKKRNERIRAADLADVKIVAPRLLFKTGSFPDPNHWNSDFNALSQELVEHLSRHGVRLVGIDTPSVDLADDKNLESHRAIYACDMRILEGIDLARVPSGVYTLIALPLNIEGADASPVRAILLEKKVDLL